jgi:predicted O-methyltransferase YrrM
VEIGALFGFTTQLIANYKPNEKKLIAIENFSWNPFGIPPDDHRTITQRVLRYVIDHCNTSIFDGSSRYFQTRYEGEKPSMVFIDADHQYESVKADIAWAVKLGIPIVAGHDYCESHSGVIRAVDEAFPTSKNILGSVWWHA